MFKNLKTNKLSKFLLIIYLILIVGCTSSSTNSKANNNTTNDSVNNINMISKDVKEVKPTKSIDEIIDSYLNDNNIDRQAISIILSDEHKIHYSLNAKKVFFAASTYKLPLAMLYYENMGNLDRKIQIMESDIEEGIVANSYFSGDYVSIRELLEYMIVYSDNTAGNRLYKNYGGWNKFLINANKYSEVDYYSISKGDNYINAQYLNDLLLYLYNNREQFSELLLYLKAATPNRYLDYFDINVPIAQKYGNFDDNLHATGIVYGNKVYFITIMTRGIINPEKRIGEINKLIYTNFK